MLDEILSYRLCCERGFSLLADVTEAEYDAQLKAHLGGSRRAHVVAMPEAASAVAVEAGGSGLTGFSTSNTATQPAELPVTPSQPSQLGMRQSVRHQWLPVGGVLDNRLTQAFDDPSRLLNECFPLLALKPFANRILFRRSGVGSYKVALISTGFEQMDLTRGVLMNVKQALYRYLDETSVDLVSDEQKSLGLELVICGDLADSPINRNWLVKFCASFLDVADFKICGLIMSDQGSSFYHTPATNWRQRRYYKQVFNQRHDKLTALVKQCQKSIYG